jgi:hypothetical protein
VGVDARLVGVWLVPFTSEGGTSVFEVTLSPDSCECRDFDYRGPGCKHVVAATIARAKSARCSGCGERFPRRRRLVEVGPEMTAFAEVLEGQRYCRPCARRHGIA